MKKFIALLLALVMVFALVACGNNETPNAPSTNKPSTPSTPNSDAPTAPAEDNDGLKYLTAGQKYPAETIKIGVPEKIIAPESEFRGQSIFKIIILRS